MASVTDLVFIDSTGYHYEDYPSFLAWIQSQYQGIYGADVYLGNDSQDGQFLAILAQAFFDVAALGNSVYNSFSPLSAQGVGLSRLVKINGLNRLVPSHSTVDLAVVGTAATTISNGVAIDTLGQKWDLPTTVVIPDAGTITVTATAELPGAIQAQPSTVTGIFTPTRGWQTVNNASAASPGQPVESDGTLRARQAVSTANPSLTVLDGQIGAVANVTGVTNIRGYENPTGSPDGNSIPAHTISIVVEGGDALTIAQTIALHKTPGTGTYGTTSEDVTDSRGMPLTINFYRPTLVTVKAQIAVHPLAGWSTDYEALIAQAFADFINGIDIGNDVQYSRLFGPAYLNGALGSATYDVETLEIAKNSGSFGTSNITIAFNELPVCDPDVDVSVTTV